MSKTKREKADATWAKTHCQCCELTLGVGYPVANDEGTDLYGEDTKSYVCEWCWEDHWRTGGEWTVTHVSKPSTRAGAVA